MDIPKLGLWTWKLDDDQCKKIIPLAYDLWYRLFDTAWIYWNEEWVWESLFWLGIQRDNYWITTKVWFDYVPNYQKHDFVEQDFIYSNLEKRLNNSYDALKTEYIDLVLLHWPTNLDNDAHAFEKLLKYKREGRILHLWVSNFPTDAMKQMVSFFWNEVEFNQFERHAFLANDVLENYLKDNAIQSISYSPLWHQHLLSNEELIKLAEELDISVSQLCLAYLLKKGFIVIPKASSIDHLKDNYSSLHINLSDEIMKKVDSLPKNYRYVNPPFAPKRN